MSTKKSYFILILVISLLLVDLFLKNFSYSKDRFNITIILEKVQNGLITGKIYVNNSLIGNAFENERYKIPVGEYKGYIRYISDRNRVQNPFGILAKQGDFYLEVANVKGLSGKDRTNILFHGGNKPEHSLGCILLGPVKKDKKTGTAYLDDDHPLRKLRLLFYGTDTPNMCPDKEISIEISQRY